jgi:hypothetical protein
MKVVLSGGFENIPGTNDYLIRVFYEDGTSDRFIAHSQKEAIGFINSILDKSK